jgi:hypothetical protein
MFCSRRHWPPAFANTMLCAVYFLFRTFTNLSKSLFSNPCPSIVNIFFPQESNRCICLNLLNFRFQSSKCNNVLLYIPTGYSLLTIFTLFTSWRSILFEKNLYRLLIIKLPCVICIRYIENIDKEKHMIPVDKHRITQ